MIDHIIQLTKKLVAIQSTRSEKKHLDLILEVAKQELAEFSIQSFERKGFPSILVSNKVISNNKYHIILNGHLDVVPAEKKLFTPFEKDGKLLGHGTYDMKAAAACMILAFKQLAREVPYALALQLVTDEEIGGHNGTKYQIEKGVRGDFIISGDASNFAIVNQAKGFTWFKITAKGAATHGAYPWLGDNAIVKMNAFLDRVLKKFPTPVKDSWVTTVNIAKMETTNMAFNEVPADCTVWLDMRHIQQDEATAIQTIQELLPKDFTMEIVLHEKSTYVPEANPYVEKLVSSAKQYVHQPLAVEQHHGGSDARLYTAVNCPAIEFGPIGGRLPDGNEWVDIKNLEAYYHILVSFLSHVS